MKLTEEQLDELVDNIISACYHDHEMGLALSAVYEKDERVELKGEIKASIEYTIEEWE